jgi:hypothetical protein
VRGADVRKEEAQIVVDLGDGPDRGPRIRAGRLLLDRDGRRQALDQVDVGLLHLLQELARVGGQRLDITALPLGIDRVEGERRLAGSRQAGDDDQLIARQVDVDILQIVNAGAAHRDPVMTHVYSREFLGNVKRSFYRSTPAGCLVLCRAPAFKGCVTKKWASAP